MKTFLFIFFIISIINAVIILALCKAASKDRDVYHEYSTDNKRKNY